MKSSSNHPGSNVESNISRSSVELPRWLASLLAASLAVSHAGAQVTTPAPAGSTQVPAAQPSTSGQVPAAQPGKSAQAPGPQPAKAAQSTAATTARTAPAPSKAGGPPSRYLPSRFAARAGSYYRLVWGIEALSVKTVESGEVIRFTYRVLDPGKAKALNDKKNEPTLIDPQAGVSLVVPQMEKIGQLRQTAPPRAGKSYWMAFSNKGRMVKRGDRVEVVIGPFRAENLVVD
jgi:hypothetical protein